MVSSYCCVIFLIIVGFESSVGRLAEPTEEPALPQIITTVTAAPQTTTQKPQPPFPDCFHYPTCDDFRTSHGGECKKLDQNKIVVCCNVNSNSLGEYFESPGVTEVESLHIINATLDVLNLGNKAWKGLKSMSMTDGNIKRVIGMFPSITSIQCLNLSNNGIMDIEKRSLTFLQNLTTLDLSTNKIELIPKIFTKKYNLSIDISNNKPLQCSNLQDTMEMLQKKDLIFQNQNNTFCVSSIVFHWFNSTESIPFSQIEHLTELSLSCPKIGNKNCTCTPHRIDIVPGKPPTLAVKVDCSELDLTELPPTLPPNTIVLNVSYNRIESLALLSDESCYKDIRELYADHNEITSILKLEGTKFIDNFAILNLRANKLKNLPTYFLSNTFDRNWNPRYVYLGRNYLNCDCNTVKTLKVWLYSKQKNIPDYDEIWCENLPQKVLELDQTKVCQYPKDWTDYIYYIITAEVLLLLGLVCKVSYDYWVFKTAGYLPWPASKMPKLPCDWLCET